MLLRVAIYQGGRPVGVKDNLESLVNEVKRQKGLLDLIVFPELYLGGYVAGEEFAKYAELKDGPSFIQISQVAKECGMAIAYGYVEKSANSSVLYNSAQLVDKHGVSLLNYQKTHLWSDYESKYFTPGSALSPVADLGNGFKAALLICFDVEYPEVCRCLALAGANVLIVPTALCTKLMTTVTVISRAIENHTFLLYSNVVGPHSSTDGSKNLTFCGNSVIGPFCLLF